MIDNCFALWSREGVAAGGLFREALDITHRPADSEHVRVRVQARQTYVFCQARRLCWEEDRADRLVSSGVDTLTGPALREDGLAGRTIGTSSLALSDTTADLYDIAFVLFALAHAGRQGHDRAISAARELLASVDRQMIDNANGGYHETLPVGPQRLQNPHMHLLEACLALHEAEPEGGHLDRAARLVALFDEKMFDIASGTIPETFRPDWSPVAAGDARYVEPGHQFEWVWLLSLYARLSDTEPSAAIPRLYSFAVRSLDRDGRAFARAARESEVIDGSRRTWMQCEALKAHLAMLELDGDDYSDERAVQCFDVLMDEYLTPEGGWIDKYHADGQVAADEMPASTGYHVVLAFCELLRVTGV
jgi:mannose-6-phosphate isomerase